MEENTNTLEEEVKVTEPEATKEPEKQERTFTQDEVNRIVADRLKRESAKNTEALTNSTNELSEATDKANKLEAELNALKEANALRDLKDKVSKSTGVPSELITATDEEAMRTQAEAILNFAKPTYPTVKDAGETQVPSITKEEIFAIKDEKTRLKAIADNIDLFN